MPWSKVWLLQPKSYTKLPNKWWSVPICKRSRLLNVQMNNLTGMLSKRLHNTRHECKRGSRDTILMTIMTSLTRKKTQAKGLVEYGSGGEQGFWTLANCLPLRKHWGLWFLHNYSVVLLSERVFSCLIMIRDICGDNLSGDMTEIRICMQRNRGTWINCLTI